MSAGVLAQPSETRIAEPASLSLAPMALSTWEGCTLPEEQAAPELTATPARSSAMSWVSAGRPASATQEVLGSRGAVAPKRSEEHTSELQSPMRSSYAVFCFTT